MADLLLDLLIKQPWLYHNPMSFKVVMLPHPAFSQFATTLSVKESGTLVAAEVYRLAVTVLEITAVMVFVAVLTLVTVVRGLWSSISPMTDVYGLAVTVLEIVAVIVFVAVSTLVTVVRGLWSSISPMTDVANDVSHSRLRQ